MFVIAILEKKTYTMCGYDIEEKGVHYELQN